MAHTHVIYKTDHIERVIPVSFLLNILPTPSMHTETLTLYCERGKEGTDKDKHGEKKRKTREQRQ